MVLNDKNLYYRHRQKQNEDKYVDNHNFVRRGQDIFGMSNQIKLDGVDNTYENGIYEDADNIVRLGGLLTQSTIINGDNNTYPFFVTSASQILFSGTNVQLYAEGNLSISTPSVIAGTATTGQVLALSNTLGLVEFVDAPAANIVSIPLTIFNGSTTISNSTVGDFLTINSDLSSKSFLSYQASVFSSDTGTFDIITNINGIDVNSTTYGSSLNTLEVTFGAGIALNIGDTIGFYANNISGIMPIGLSITLNIQ